MTRYVTSAEGRYEQPPASSADGPLESTPAEPEMEDPERFRLMRLCHCNICDGTGKLGHDQIVAYAERKGRAKDLRKDISPDVVIRCDVCRGEGKVLEEVATCGTKEAVGAALVTLAREGEFDCPFGLIDRQGETGKKWLVKPWPASPRNVSDAGRTLAKARHHG